MAPLMTRLLTVCLISQGSGLVFQLPPTPRLLAFHLPADAQIVSLLFGMAFFPSSPGGCLVTLPCPVRLFSSTGFPPRLETPVLQDPLRPLDHWSPSAVPSSACWLWFSDISDHDKASSNSQRSHHFQ